ncbi:OadG family protein [Salinispirillum sp. LH 10-3-1]|uniref:Oxaloacetate decarboxylase gamma chain n=1 Tax=Salinispirillum sp. LH 10-3-1 TaxID=2952525 RepID=A0AB38YIJ8_9GAMM
MSDLMQEGLALMVLGMGTVFTFLIILTLATGFMSAILRKTSQPVPQAAGGGRTQSSQMEKIAAVAAAAKAAHDR